MVQLEPDERPRAAGDVGEPRPTAAGTPTTADAVSCEPTAHTGTGVAAATWCASASSVPDLRARVLHRREQRRRPGRGGRQISADHRRVRMSSSPVVDALVTLAGALAGQPEAHQVGDHQQPVRDLERRRPPGRGELVDGVERQELQACSLRTGSRRPGPRPPCPSPRRCGGPGSGPGCRAAGRTGRAVRSPPPRSRRRSPSSRPAARAAVADAVHAHRRTGRGRPSSSVPATCTGRLANRWTSVRSRTSGPACPSMTRPLDAPRSTATTSAVRSRRPP